MADTNGAYTLFAGLVNQYKKVENGLVGLFQSRPRNIFGGDKVTFDIIKRARTLPEAKEKNGGYDTLETDKFKNVEFSPPSYKERSNYSISQTSGRQAGTTIYDDVDKTALLMDKTADDLALLLDRIELGMVLQAAEIFQYGQIRFNSVYGYRVNDLDFECPSAHFATVGTLWTAGAGDPISDIETHIKLINKAGRTRIDNIIFGQTALTDFLQNARVKAELDNRRIDRGNLTFEPIRLDGFQRVGIYNIGGVNVTFWTYDEWYETKDADDVVDGTVDFIDPKFVVFFSSKGDYQRYFAGIDTIKTIPKDLAGFLPSPNINIVGESTAMDVYVDTKEISDGANEGVYLRAASRPLLVPRTNDTFGRLTVSA